MMVSGLTRQGQSFERTGPGGRQLGQAEFARGQGDGLLTRCRDMQELDRLDAEEYDGS